MLLGNNFGNFGKVKKRFKKLADNLNIGQRLKTGITNNLSLTGGLGEFSVRIILRILRIMAFTVDFVYRR